MLALTHDFALALGVMITVGVLGGVLSNRVSFPRVTGYIIVGIVLSPSVLNLVSVPMLESLDIITHIALAIIAYLIGASLRLESIKKLGRSIAIITPFESLIAWLCVTLALAFIGPRILAVPGAAFARNYLPVALVIGAIACATAPAVTMAVIREYKAKGPLTTTLLAVVALDDAIAVTAFAVSVGVAQSLAGGVAVLSPYHMFAPPALEITKSIGIGVGLGFVLINMVKLAKSRALLLLVVLGVIILCAGATNYLGASLIMANMMVGFVVANRGSNEEAVTVMSSIEDVVFAVFFVLAGMHFDSSVMGTAGILAAVVFGFRFLGKYLGVRAGARLSHAPEVVKKYLAFGLAPQAGVALGLALLAKTMFPTLGNIMFNVVLASVIINELVSPPMTKYAISSAGEVGSAGVALPRPQC